MKITSQINNSNILYDKKYNTYFILGFFSFCLFTGLIGLRTNPGLNKIYELFQIIGIILISIGLKNLTKTIESEIFKIIFMIFILWSIIIITKGFTFDYNYIKRFILGHGTKYLIPMAIFLPQKLDLYKKIFFGIAILGVFFLLISFLNIRMITTIFDTNVDQKFSFEILAHELALPSGLVLFTFKYHKKEINILAFIVLIFVLLISLYTARRAYIIFSSLELILFFFIYFIETKNKHLIVISSLIALVVVIFFGSQLIDKSFEKRFLGKIQERSTENTRAGLELVFMAQLSEKDWVIGRGINGKYNFSQNIEITDEAGNRDMIEGQILDAILKGGLIYLILLMVIIVPATILNLFFSNNMLSRGFGYLMILFLFSLYPANYIKFNLIYLLVWIGVGIAFTQSTRNIPDILFRKYFKSIK